MKVVIRGERGVGKSALLTRLQGGDFKPEYTPTPEIQSATVRWGYKRSDDSVKVWQSMACMPYAPLLMHTHARMRARTQVEVWDVVDRALVSKQAHADPDRPAGVLRALLALPRPR